MEAENTPDMLYELFAKFCNPAEHLVIDKFIVVKLDGQVIFRLHLTYSPHGAESFLSS